jgi:hypothetical protein
VETPTRDSEKDVLANDGVVDIRNG